MVIPLFGPDDDKFQTAAGEDLRGVAVGSMISASVWVSYELVDA